MTNNEIYEAVEKYVKENLATLPFDKAQPALQNYVWSLGDQIGKTGSEIMKIYFDIKSEKK